MGIITFSFVDFWCYSFFIIYIHSIVSNFIEFDFNYLVDKYNSIVPGILIHSAYNFTVTFIRYNIRYFDFATYEIPIMVVSILTFIFSIICIIFNTKKLSSN